jgi:hypothetical protein
MFLHCPLAIKHSYFHGKSERQMCQRAFKSIMFSTYRHCYLTHTQAHKIKPIAHTCAHTLTSIYKHDGWPHSWSRRDIIWPHAPDNAYTNSHTYTFDHMPFFCEPRNHDKWGTLHSILLSSRYTHVFTRTTLDTDTAWPPGLALFLCIQQPYFTRSHPISCSLSFHMCPIKEWPVNCHSYVGYLPWTVSHSFKPYRGGLCVPCVQHGSYFLL